MDLDNLHFDNDEERRRYLAQLAKLKKYRENAAQQGYTQNGGYSPYQEEYIPDYDGFSSVDVSQGSTDAEYGSQNYSDGGYGSQGYVDSEYGSHGYSDNGYNSTSAYDDEIERERAELRRRERELNEKERRLRAERERYQRAQQREQQRQREEREQHQRSNSDRSDNRSSRNSDRQSERRSDRSQKNTEDRRSRNRERDTQYTGDNRQYYDDDRQYARSSRTRKLYEVDDRDNEYYDEEEKPKKKSHIFLIILLLLLLALIGYFAYHYFTKQTGHYTVAVFGLDSRNGNVGKEALSDVNIIADVNRETGEIKLVSIYRDTYVQINSEGTYHKFNEAYFRGGPEQALWTIEHNMDVKCDDYAAFNWKAVVDTINILGGVDIEITDSEFAYINGFITETVNSTGVGSYQLEHAGMNHLDGVQAVAYARLRLMDTDFQRTERQRKVISLAFEKAKDADFATLNCIMETVLPQINTSVSLNDMIPFAQDISKYHLAETAGYPFEKTTADIGKLDAVVAVTLETNAVALHQFLWPEEEYTPSAGLVAISDKIIGETGLGATGNTTVKVDNLDEPIGNTGAPSGGGSSEQSAEPEIQIDQGAETLAETASEGDGQGNQGDQTVMAPPESKQGPDPVSGGSSSSTQATETVKESESVKESETVKPSESETVKPSESETEAERETIETVEEPTKESSNGNAPPGDDIETLPEEGPGMD